MHADGPVPVLYVCAGSDPVQLHNAYRAVHQAGEDLAR